MSNCRIKWLDVVKGFAIILVILGHSGISTTNKFIYVWIYSFHMPLFFILSGYVFSIKKYESYIEFLIKKIKTLIIPYLVFQLLQMTVQYMYNAILHLHEERTVLDHILGLLLQIRDSRYASGLWFLTCLFIIENIFYFFLKHSKAKYDIYIAVVTIACVGCIYNYFIGLNLPWYFDLVCISLPFFAFGYFLKQCTLLDKFAKNQFMLFFVAHFILLATNYRITGLPVDMYYNQFGNYILFYLSGFTGSLSFILLFKTINRSNVILEYIGKNSLIYYVLHQVIVMPIASVILKLFITTPVQDFNEFGAFAFWLLKTALVCAIITPLSYIVNRYFYMTIGKKQF